MQALAFSPSTQKHELLYQESYISIYYNFEDNWIYSEWHGKQSDETIIAGIEKLLELTRLKRCHKILNNSTKLNYIWVDMADWVATDFVPRLYEAGVEYFAWIYNDNNPTRLGADKVLKKQTSDIIVVVFDNVATAEKWLRSLN